MSRLGGLFVSVPSVNANEARTLIDEGAAMVDVRTQAEWDAGHSEVATHLPLQELSGALAGVPRTSKVVVICRSGNRSRGATQQLIDAGYDAVNLTGGMYAWVGAGERVVDQSGRPGVVA